jgi:hypothetical protein
VRSGTGTHLLGTLLTFLDFFAFFAFPSSGFGHGRQRGGTLRPAATSFWQPAFAGRSNSARTEVAAVALTGREDPNTIARALTHITNR